MSPRWQLPPDAIDRYVNAEETLAELAAEYGTSPQTLGRRLRERGVQLRSYTKTERHRQRLADSRQTPVDDEQIRQLAASGLICHEIATVLDVSPNVVYTRMIALDVPRLPANGARPGRHNGSWKGGQRREEKGSYFSIYAPDHPHARGGRVAEHRFVMEQTLGRYLLPGEVVDHIDGNPSNNNPDNLRVFLSNAEHLRVTLAGRTPNWTEDGKRRIREGAQKAARQRVANRQESRIDDQR